MQPVVVDPKISFTQLVEELGTVNGDRNSSSWCATSSSPSCSARSGTSSEGPAGLRDEVPACRRTPSSASCSDDAAAGDRRLVHAEPGPRARSSTGSAGTAQRAGADLRRTRTRCYSVEHGYGEGQEARGLPQGVHGLHPEPKRTSIPALSTVLTRPRELTRKQLRELALALDTAGFTESEPGHRLARHDQPGDRRAASSATSARRPSATRWCPTSSGWTGRSQKILATRAWTTPQRQWLQKIAAQTKANLIVDREALDDPDLIFKREGGGFTRLDKLFDGELEQVLDTFNECALAAARPDHRQEFGTYMSQRHPRHRPEALEPVQRRSRTTGSPTTSTSPS